MAADTNYFAPLPYRKIQPDLEPGAAWEARQSGIALRQSDNRITSDAAQASQDPLIRLVDAIKINTDIDILLKTINLGFIGRVINLTAGVQALIIPKAKQTRGYIIINPAEVVGFTSTITLFSSLARAPATYTSAAFNVSGVDTARFFLDVTANATPLTLQVNVQTQDPLTGNWATSQTDIYGGSNAVGTYYAAVGPFGVDRLLRLQAIVGAGAGTATFSISGLLKGGTLTPQGTSVYIGPQNVNALTGYPILPGQREFFYLRDDVEIFAISPIEPMTIKVFQLQG